MISEKYKIIILKAGNPIKIKNMLQILLEHSVLQFHFSMRKGWHAISRKRMKHQIQQSKNCETTNSDPSDSMGQTCIEMSNDSPGINTLYK